MNCALSLLDQSGARLKLPRLPQLLDELSNIEDSSACKTRAEFMLVGTGVTPAQIATLVRLYENQGLDSTDMETIQLHELTPEIDAAGNLFAVLDADEIVLNAEGCWFINKRPVDDFATAVYVLISKRHLKRDEQTQ